MADLSPEDLAVRSAVYARFAAGDVPSASEVAADLAMDVDAVIECYERLAAAHVLVLDPDSREVWMAMPFSAVPTAFVVTGLGRQWFANCAWDAFGIAVALSCDVSIATYCLDAACRRPTASATASSPIATVWFISRCPRGSGGTTSDSRDRPFGSSGLKSTSRSGPYRAGRSAPRCRSRHCGNSLSSGSMDGCHQSGRLARPSNRSSCSRRPASSGGSGRSCGDR